MGRNKTSDWFWTEEQTNTAIAMGIANYSAGEIAQVVGKSKSGTADKLNRLRHAGVDIPYRSYDKQEVAREACFVKEENKKLVTTKRTCLKCQDTFDSWGIGNRVCSPCKKTKSWLAGDVDMPVNRNDRVA